MGFFSNWMIENEEKVFSDFVKEYKYKINNLFSEKYYLNYDTIEYFISEGDEKIKQELENDWQDYLVSYQANNLEDS